MLRFLSSESEQLQWKAQGLPADGLFMENAVMLQFGTLTPLVVDPGSQATAWLIKKLSGAQATVESITQQVRLIRVLLSYYGLCLMLVVSCVRLCVCLQDPRFTKQLELAVRFGKTLVVTEIDSVDPVLVPLLRRDLLHEGPRFVVMVRVLFVHLHCFVVLLTDCACICLCVCVSVGGRSTSRLPRELPPVSGHAKLLSNFTAGCRFASVCRQLHGDAFRSRSAVAWIDTAERTTGVGDAKVGFVA